MRNLHGHVVLLLDAREMAPDLVTAGARVFLVELSPIALGEAIAAIGHNDADGLDAAPSDPTAIDRAVKRASRRFGRVDAVVAGPLWRGVRVGDPYPQFEIPGDSAALIEELASVLGGPLPR